MSAEPAVVDDRAEYAGVLRFYELAKHQEWQVRDVPWGEIPPVPEGKGTSERRARRSGVPFPSGTGGSSPHGRSLTCHSTRFARS